MMIVGFSKRQVISAAAVLTLMIEMVALAFLIDSVHAQDRTKTARAKTHIAKDRTSDKNFQIESYRKWSAGKSANGRYGATDDAPFKFEWLKAGLRHMITWNGAPTWLITAEQGSASFDRRGNGFISVHYHIAKSEKGDGGPGLTVIFNVVAGRTTSLRLVGSVYRDGQEVVIDGRDFRRLEE